MMYAFLFLFLSFPLLTFGLIWKTIPTGSVRPPIRRDGYMSMLPNSSTRGYIFGGRTETGQVLNDVWTFAEDPQVLGTFMWTQVVIDNDVLPPPRFSLLADFIMVSYLCNNTLNLIM